MCIKDNKGITLVALIVTVIVMLILIGVGIFNADQAYKNGQVSKFVTQMQLIQARIDEVIGDTDFITEITAEKPAITSDDISILDKAHQNHEIPYDSSIEYNSEYKNQFKHFTISNLDEELDLSDIDTDVLINFTTKEIVAIDGVEYKDVVYYTQYLLPQGQTLIQYNNQREEEIDFTVNKKMDGLNCSITITDIPADCKLSYGEGASANDVTNWITLANYTKVNDSYSLNITKKRNIYF